MRALFFVYTPFQFLVAQSIIKQEGFKNSVLIEGYVGDNTHFLDVYKLLKIDELWASTYVIPELPQWDGLVIRSINDAKKAESERQIWSNHNTLERGNAKKTFKGEL